MFSRRNWKTSSRTRAERAFSQTFVKARIEILESSPGLSVEFDVISLGGVSLIRNSLGPSVNLLCERTSDFLFTVAHEGRCEFTFGNKSSICNRSMGTMLSPVRNLKIWRSRGSENTVLKMDHKILYSALQDLIAEPVATPLRFEPKVNVGNGNGASMKRLLEHLFDEVQRGDTGMSVPQVAENTSRALITNALFLLKHNYSEIIIGLKSDSPLPVLMQVEKYIDNNYQETVSDKLLADLSGKSYITLYRLFMKHRGYTPMQYLKRTRMLHARKRLLSPEPEDSVTLIASECGFTHFSRFAGDYRTQYGEKPAETLRKGRMKS